MASFCSGLKEIGLLSLVICIGFKDNCLFFIAAIAFLAVAKSILYHSLPIVSPILVFLIPEFFSTSFTL